jgi:hypothetical protein
MGDCRPFTPLQLRYPAPRLPLLPVQGAVPLPVPEQGGSLAALYLYDIYYSFSAQWRHLSLRALKIHFIPGWEENQGTRLSYNFWRTMWHRYRLVSPGTQGMAISQLRLLEMLRISRRIILRHAYAMRPLTLGLSATSRHWCAPLRESNPGRPFPERIDGSRLSLRAGRFPGRLGCWDWLLSRRSRATSSPLSDKSGGPTDRWGVGRPRADC